MDVCVYTITDDRIKRILLSLHAHGIRVRILTDDDKVQDQGSDIVELRNAGIQVSFVV